MCWVLEVFPEGAVAEAVMLLEIETNYIILAWEIIEEAGFYFCNVVTDRITRSLLANSLSNMSNMVETELPLLVRTSREV